MENALEPAIAEEIYQAGKQEAGNLAEKVDMLIRVHEQIGGLKTMEFQRSQHDFLFYLSLYNLKESKEYVQLGYTWSKVCDSVGIPQRSTERTLTDLRKLFDVYTEKMTAVTGISINNLRRLGRTMTDAEVEPDTAEITVDGVTIPLSGDPVTAEQAIKRILTKNKNEVARMKEESEKMAKKVKRLESRLEQEVEEETRALQAERDGLLKENEGLKKMLPDSEPKNSKAWDALFAGVTEAAAAFRAACAKIAAIPENEIRERMHNGKLMGLIDGVDAIFSDMRHDIETRLEMYRD